MEQDRRPEILAEVIAKTIEEFDAARNKDRREKARLVSITVALAVSSGSADDLADFAVALLAQNKDK